MNETFAKQREIIEHPARLKALLASRRFGKSYLAALYLIITALKTPNIAVLYLAMTRESAKDIMLDQKLILILNKFNIQYQLNLTSLIIRFNNGSTIKLQGADSNEREPAKLRGKAFSLIVIDECQDFTTDLRKTVYAVLKATTIDNQGTIILLGTPGNLIETENPPLFYSVTTEQEFKYPWVVFKGNTVDNPYMKVNFENEIAEQLKYNPGWADSNDYKREYLGQWVVDTDRVIYKFNAIRNVIHEVPQADKFTYVMGLDFGFNDHSAFVVGAYSKYDPNLYIVKTFKKTKMTLDDVQEKLIEYMTQYKLNRIICDHSAQMVETLRNRLHYNFVPAEKIDKFEYIDLMNDDLQAGKVKLLPGTDELKREWNSLVFDHRSPKPKELDSCENHLSDASLYMWRDSRHYLAKPVKNNFIKDTIDYWDEEEKRRLKKKQIMERLGVSSAEIDFNE